MSRGAVMAGLQVRWGLDKDEPAMNTFALNFGPSGTRVLCGGWKDLIKEPAESFEKLKVDILHFSPPCQPQSWVNTRPNRKRNKENRECLQAIKPILERLKPRIATLESVQGLLDSKREIVEDRATILESFKSLGYIVRSKMIDCAELGLPQYRRRLFLIACR